MNQKKFAVIAGAGPAGLTAAYELLQQSDIVPIVFESDSQVGGISKTINYKGNRMDLGGHRFFSKSDWVMQWWQNILPVSPEDLERFPETKLQYQGSERSFNGSRLAPAHPDRVLMIRSRLSRIYYRRNFFDYPLKLSVSTLTKLGALYTLSIGISYVAARLFKRSPEVSLEDFLINRFGNKLYRTFFKDYTEKVWGVPCSRISAEWGAQRIKGLSISKAIKHALATPFQAKNMAQKTTETSLIERFLYPKLGPGQMWEVVAGKIQQQGGQVHLQHKVVGIERHGATITGIEVLNTTTGTTYIQPCDYFLSTLPIKQLTEYLRPQDSNVARIAASLPYRDFMTAGLLVKRMKTKDMMAPVNGMPPDNWIYIQEPDVKLGRLQVFNNWSPALVADPNTIWLGLEYFCDEGDELWRKADSEFLKFAAQELAQIGLIETTDVLDGTVVRVPKAYPAYFGEYQRIGLVREYLDTFDNLYPIGRNGMHRYNNQDHSMLAAKAAVECIIGQSTDKTSLWSINSEEDYHETK